MSINKSAIITSVILVVIMILYCITFVNDYDNLIGFILLIVLLLAYLLVLKNKEKKVKNILIIAIILRLILLVHTNYFGNDGDWDGYGKMAESFVKMNFGTYLKNFQTGAYLYSWFIAGIWKVTGISYMAIRVINMFISCYCCIVGYNLTLKVTNNKSVAEKMLLFISIFPNLIRFSVPFANREPLFIMFLLLAIDNLYEYYKNRRLNNLFKFFLK